MHNYVNNKYLFKTYRITSEKLSKIHLGTIRNKTAQLEYTELQHFLSMQKIWYTRLSKISGGFFKISDKKALQILDFSKNPIKLQKFLVVSQKYKKKLKIFPNFSKKQIG